MTDQPAPTALLPAPPDRPRGRVALAAAAVALALVSGLGGFALGLAADGPDAGTQVATSGTTTDGGTGQDGLPGRPPDLGGGLGGLPPGSSGGYGPGALPDGTLPDGTDDGTTEGVDPGAVTGDTA